MILDITAIKAKVVMPVHTLLDTFEELHEVKPLET